MKVECPICGHKDTTTVSDKGVVESHKKSMDQEKTHTWSDEYSCPECGNETVVEHNKWEYPEGIINSEDTKCT